MSALLCEFLVVLLDYTICASFIVKILKEQFRLPMNMILSGSVILIILYDLIDLLIANLPDNTTLPLINSTVTGFIWLIITYLTLIRVTKEGKDRLLFLMFIGNNMIMLCRSITLLGYSIFSPQLLSSDYSFIDLLCFGIPVLVVFSILTPIIKQYYLTWRTLDSHTYARLWIIPLFFYLLSSLQINLYPADEYTLVNAAKISIILCAFITYSQMINAVVKTANIAKEREFKKQLIQQLDSEQARIRDLEVYLEEIRRIRHDHRQHLHVLRGLLEDNQKKDMLNYLDQYEASIQTSVRPPLCEHHITDTLCRRYEALATQSNICVKLQINLPQDVKIHVQDFAVLLGNLWENSITAALDADEKERFIHLWIQTQKDKVMIKMENGYGGEIICREDKFLSTKPNRDNEEGIGIHSIQSIVSSYGGTVDFSYTDHCFTASVLLYTKNEIS